MKEPTDLVTSVQKSTAELALVHHDDLGDLLLKVRLHHYDQNLTNLMSRRRTLILPMSGTSAFGFDI